ncbi:hypothetical protein PIB30_043426 [Stylosanthes scabra]|uniref:Uncharacterized protein n=1 Tax=Stylosanthes scabra TaxID=79078 RepID=A0ABU6THC3_9FABA|nr:hypothetical protein [Stylosanthes scabra]
MLNKLQFADALTITSSVNVNLPKEVMRFEVREMAAEAHSGMVKVPKKGKMFVQLLDPEEEGKSGNNKFWSLTCCISVRKKKIASSKYAKTKQILASESAKRPTNRFRKMLSGIYHRRHQHHHSQYNYKILTFFLGFTKGTSV